MNQAQSIRGAGRTVRLAAASAALFLAAGLGSFGLSSLVDPAPVEGDRLAAVLEAGAEWERQRDLQSVQYDQVLMSAKEWERQRRQQSVQRDPVLDSAEAWEAQRRQQTPVSVG